MTKKQTITPTPSARGFVTSRKFTKRTYLGMNATSRILSVLAQSKKALSAQQISENTEVVLTTVRRHLRKMNEGGLLVLAPVAINASTTARFWSLKV